MGVRNLPKVFLHGSDVAGSWTSHLRYTLTL